MWLRRETILAGSCFLLLKLRPKTDFYELCCLTLAREKIMSILNSFAPATFAISSAVSTLVGFMFYAFDMLSFPHSVIVIHDPAEWT